MVKHTYQDCWYIPGGEVGKGETTEEAIRREIQEELGGEIYSMELFGVYSSFFESKNDHIIVFLSNNFTVKGSVSDEIEAIESFPIDDLPNTISSGSKRRINEFIKRGKGNFGRW